MIKLITHTDLDGIVCYIVAKYFYEAIDVAYCNYDNVNEEIEKTLYNHEKYSKIFITDISPSNYLTNVIDGFNSFNPNKLHLLDHHKTALHLNEYSWATVKTQTLDYKHCGTELFYNYLVEEFQKEFQDDIEYCTMHLAKLVEKVRRYDTWEWHNKYGDTSAKQLNDLFKIYGRDTFIYNMSEKLYPNEEELINDTDKFVLNLEQEKINRYICNKQKELIVKTIIISEIEFTFGVVLAENYLSELGNELSKNNPDLDFIAMINQKAVSLRTTSSDVDLSKIAFLFDGGGHEKAAGFSVDKEYVNSFINEIFELNI